MTLHHPLYHRIFDRRLEPGVCVSACPRPRPLIHCLSIDNNKDDVGKVRGSSLFFYRRTADHDKLQVSSRHL